MGASDWHYVVDYQADAGRAFAELRQSVLTDGNYYHGLGGRHTFGSLSDLAAARETETFWDEGTHSILDVVEVAGADRPSGVAVVRLLTDAEARATFGTTCPTRADVDHFLTTDWWVDRWEGRAVALHRDGEPHELAFWASRATRQSQAIPQRYCAVSSWHTRIGSSTYVETEIIHAFPGG